MMGHKICFYGEEWLIISDLSLLPLLIWSSAYSGINMEFSLIPEDPEKAGLSTVSTINRYQHHHVSLGTFQLI